MDLEGNRKIREKDFHDEILATKARRQLSIFYSINDSIRKEFKELLSAYYSKRILEIGCGLGTNAISMAEKETRISAIDISEYAIKTAKKRAINKNLKIDFRVMDAENLEFEDNEFDLVYGISILHHVNLEKIVSEIRRVLKTGCEAIFIEPMAHNPFIKIFRILTPRLRSRDEHPLRMKDLQLLREEFPSYEFKHYYFLSLFAVVFYRLPLYNKIKHLLEKVDETIFAVLPMINRFSWQVLLIFKK